jgi:hypothetical protein
VPAAYVDWEVPCIRALREIRPGEEITINYMTIYEVITTPFECGCGVETCYHRISGFHGLSMDQKLALELYLSPYLKSVLKRQPIARGAQAS